MSTPAPITAPAAAPLDPHASDYVARHQPYNIRLYLLATGFGAISATFGDPSVLMTNLGAKIGAPGWLKVLPMVAAMTLSYVTVILMGWWMTPSMSRKKCFFFTVGPTYAMYFILGTALWMDRPPNELVTAMIVSVVLWAFIDGFSMLPCWDLLARICQKDGRARMMSMAGAVSYITMIAASMVVAWIVSGNSPLKYPHNYALCVTIYSIAGIAGAGVLLFSKEQQHDDDGPRLPPREYLKSLKKIVRDDKPFRDLVVVACMGAMLQTIAPVFLVYAQTSRGFSDEDVSLLIALKPWAYMTVSLAGVWLAPRLGNLRMAMLQVGFVAMAAILAPALPGKWQVAAQLLGGLSMQIYTFMLLAVMHHAPPKLNTQYLTVYYVLAIVPGCFPLLMGEMVADHPGVVLASILCVAAVVLVQLWRLHAKYHDTAMEQA